MGDRFRPRGLRRGLALTLAAGVVLGAAVAGPAQAVLTGRIATISEAQRYVHESDAWVTTSAAWVSVPGANRTFTIPAGQVRMFDARYTAESMCSGSGGWCSVRIVYFAPNGAVVELDPVVGTDFAFDSVGDLWEGHAIERASKFLAAGSYRVQVQAVVVAGASSLRLDDWTLAVEMVRP